MSESVSHLPDEAFADLEPSFVESLFDDAQAWAQRALRDAEGEISLLDASYEKFLAAWIENPVEDEEDIDDRASTGEDFRGLIEIALAKAQAAREVIESEETSLSALRALT